EILHHVDHKQWIALGAFINGVAQQRRKMMAREASGEIGSDLRFLKKGQGEFLTAAMQLQLLFHDMKRMIFDSHVSRAVGADDKELRRRFTLRQERNEIEGRVITPVEVFEHQNERLLGSESFDGFRHLPEHALSGDALNALLQDLEVCWANDAWHLYEPTWGIAR